MEDTKPLLFLERSSGDHLLYSENCRLPEQLAIFFDSKGRMTVDKNLWEKMDTYSSAALLKHESYYWNERQEGETTSESTRSWVRQEAATGFVPAVDGVGSAEKMLCVQRQLKTPTQYFLFTSYSDGIIDRRHCTSNVHRR